MTGRRQCEFALCTAPAEHEVLLGTGDQLAAITAACGLHVTPMVVWGRAPADAAVVRPVS